MSLLDYVYILKIYLKINNIIGIYANEYDVIAYNFLVGI